MIQRVEQICAIFTGDLGRLLILQSQFLEGSATGRLIVCDSWSENLVMQWSLLPPIESCTAGSMQSNADYSPPPSSFYNFGGTSRCLNVTIFDDPIHEGTENFTGQLTGVLTGAGVVPNIPRLTIQPRQTTIQITDNDGKYFLANFP